MLAAGQMVAPAAVVGVAAIAAAAWLGSRAARERRRADEEAAGRRRLEALLASTALPYCGWSGGTRVVSGDLAPLLGVGPIDKPEDLEAAFGAGDAAALNGAMHHLQADGLGFDLAMTAEATGRTLRIQGRRGRAGGDVFDVLWFTDATALADEARRQAEAAASFRTMLDALPVPVWIRNPDLAIAWCNTAYGDAVDAAAEDAVAECRELTAASGRSDPLAAARRALADGSAEEQRHVVIDGARRRLLIRETRLADGRILGHAEDTTQLEEAQLTLGRHISAHAAVLEQLGSAIAIFGPDTRLSFYNQAYVQLWELDEAWLETEPSFGEILDDMHARRRLPETADFPRTKREMLSLFTSLIEPREDMMHLPDGTALRLLVVPHPFGGLMFVLEDVTTALALESSYNTLMAVQRETLDNLAEGIAVFGGDGRLKLWNPAYARIWQLTAEHLEGNPHIVQVMDRVQHLYQHGEDWPQFREQMIDDLLDRVQRSGRIERTDGSVVEFANVPLPDGAVLLSVLDVTDSARVEQALRERNAALEDADRLKSAFIANVSYQLRTPLNALVGFAEILNNAYFGPLNPRQAEYAAGILESGRTLANLISDILDLATIEAGYMTLDRRQVDVAAMLGDVMELAQDWVRKERLRLVLDCPQDIGTFEADERRLKQVLFNLMGNAVKFTPAGGTITLSATRQPGALVLAVADSGIGIPKTDQKRIFGLFERGERAGGRDAGAGLGLSLVERFVELHGGRVEIDSRVGEGTTVRCFLPTEPPSSIQ